MDVFYEKNLVNHSIDTHKKRPIVFRIIRIVCVIIAIAIVFIFANAFLSSEVTGCNATEVLWQLAFFLAMLATPVLGFIFLGRLNVRLNIEYDYHILGDTFRIIKVIHRKKRKKHLEFPVSAISSLGLAESESFLRYAGDKANKKQYTFCNEDAEPLIYMLVNTGTGRQLLVLEADDEFLTNLRRVIRTYSVMDDSIKQYFNKLAETEQKTTEPVSETKSDEKPLLIEKKKPIIAFKPVQKTIDAVGRVLIYDGAERE